MAGGFSVANNEHLIRSNLWSRQLKQLLLDDLCAMQFVKMIEEFPDGTTINIPSIGEAETSDYSEGQSIKYSRLDTGNFTFSFDQYKYSAHSITEKFKRDSFYAQEVISAFVPRQHRALMEAIETRIWDRMNASQTAAAVNAINGADHRWVGSGTSESIALKDFQKARYALTKANVPLTNLVAIIDPSVEYTIATQANLVNLLSDVPQWESVTREGISTGMRFRFNIFGFDCYVSNYLPRDIAETIGALSTTVGVANFFFSAAPGDTLPVIGGFRQHPTVYSEFNKDLQQTEYLTIAEYGFKVYRPENIVTVLTDTNVVS
jgi:hypothetical protein